MSTTNINIRTDKHIKDEAEKIFSELGLNMSTAINMFLRSTIRENGIPFNLSLNTPNKKTAQAIEEGKKILDDDSIESYSNIEDLKKALGVWNIK